VAEFYGHGDELHLAFNFTPMFTPWDADSWRTRIDRAVAEFDPIDAWPTWVLSNHDNPRHRTRYGSDARGRVACLLLLGLRGTPFLYAGEELGLEDAVVPPHRVVDPGGRDGCRGPIPWTAEPAHGWASPDPWLPWSCGDDAATQEADPSSMLNLYQHALRVRRSSPALTGGTFEWRESPDGVLMWERAAGDDTRVVVVNMTDAATAVSLPGSWQVDVSTEPVTLPGTIPGSAAAWLSRVAG
jgi:alpha-glucosidase